MMCFVDEVESGDLVSVLQASQPSSLTISVTHPGIRNVVIVQITSCPGLDLFLKVPLYQLVDKGPTQELHTPGLV